MRNLVISRIKQFAQDLDDDDLDWFNWNQQSNQQLIDMLITYARVAEGG